MKTTHTHLVVGSGPSLLVNGQCATAYFANGAVAKLGTITPRYSVHLITEQLLHKLPPHHSEFRRQSLLQGKSTNRLVVIGASRKKHELLTTQSLNYTTLETVNISAAQKEWETNHFIGKNLALLSLRRGAPFYAGVKSMIRSALFGTSLHHSLRVSTGVYAIIYAINNTPSDETIIITGIGGTSRLNVDSGVTYSKIGHMPADRLILEHIGFKYPNVFTFDNDLSITCGIPLAT